MTGRGDLAAADGMEAAPGRSELFSGRAHYARLLAETAPVLAFRATTAADAEGWRERVWAELSAALGGFPAERCPLSPIVTERVETRAYRRERVVFASEPGVAVPAYLLLPRAGGRRLPAVLCLHGHGRGKDDVVGIASSLRERQRLRALGYDYAHRLAERGYVVLAPDARAFGERGADGMGCAWAMTAALVLGTTLVGLRVWDAMRAIDYLQSRPEVDPDRIGCVGLSWGGTHAAYTAALDERLAATVVSGSFGTFAEMLLGDEECACQYVPGLLRLIELPDLLAAIAPRPLLIEQGIDDVLASPPTVRAAFAQLRAAYRVAGAEERVALDRFAGGHRFHGRRAFPWLDRWLKGSVRAGEG